LKTRTEEGKQGIVSGMEKGEGRLSFLSDRLKESYTSIYQERIKYFLKVF